MWTRSPAPWIMIVSNRVNAAQSMTIESATSGKLTMVDSTATAPSTTFLDLSRLACPQLRQLSWPGTWTSACSANCFPQRFVSCDWIWRGSANTGKKVKGASCISARRASNLSGWLVATRTELPIRNHATTRCYRQICAERMLDKLTW